MLRAPSLDSWWWKLLENYVYRIPEPPPRRRTKPMEVICVGPPRSGTESLQQALLTLGYDHTFHGWDILFEEHTRMPAWVRLCRKKWYGDESGDVTISAAEFDELLGHAIAVTDVAASAFAAEMIAAYPDAKVILNTRHDLEAWHHSAVKTLVGINDNWVFWLGSMFEREFFWAWHVYERFMLPVFFRAPDGNMATAIRRNGKWVYREHCNMIRGLVPKERLLEWEIGDGWEPLCKFLGKLVPNVKFPHVNTIGKGWKEREGQATKKWVKKAFINMSVILSILVGVGAGAYMYKW